MDKGVSMESGEIELKKGITIPTQLKLNTKLFTQDSTNPDDVELFLIYNQATGHFMADALKFTTDYEEWATQTFSPISILIMQGHTKEAVSLAEAELAEDPYAWEAMNNLAVAHSWNNDHEFALESTNKAIELAIEENQRNGSSGTPTADQAFLYQNRAIDLSNLGRFDEAITSMQKRIEIDPDTIYSHALKAEFLIETEQHLEAMREYEIALTKNSSLEWAGKHRAMIAQELGFHGDNSVENALNHVRSQIETLEGSNQDKNPELIATADISL